MRSNPILLSGKIIFLIAMIFTTTYMLTYCSPKLVSFFANCVSLEILSLPEMLFCNDKGMFCCCITILRQSQEIQKTDFT